MHHFFYAIHANVRQTFHHNEHRNTTLSETPEMTVPAVRTTNASEAKWQKSYYSNVWLYFSIFCSEFVQCTSVFWVLS